MTYNPWQRIVRPLTLLAALGMTCAAEADPPVGLVVVVGLPDASQAIAAAATGQVVQGYDRDPARVVAARAAIRASGLSHRVFADALTEPLVPVAERLASRIVVADNQGIPQVELERSLAPGGTIAVVQGATITSPRPGTIDAWTHYLYDAGGNAVSHDQEVAPPRHLQWIDHPLAYRSHSWNQSFAGLVTAGGRVFAFQDEGPVGVLDHRFPERWALVCRDAWNGLVLWRQPLIDWGWRAWEDPGPSNGPAYSGLRETGVKSGNIQGLWGTPLNLNRRIVVTPDEVFVTLSYRGHLSVLDAATGQMRRSFPAIREVDEILAPDPQTLVLSVRTIPVRNAVTGTPDQRVFAERLAAEADATAVVAINPANGAERWRVAVRRLAPLTLAVRGGRVCGIDGPSVFCLDLASGAELWRQPFEPPQTMTRRGGGVLLLADDLVFVAGKGFRCLDAATGAERWAANGGARGQFGEYLGFFVADGALWLQADQGLDPRTGKPVRQTAIGDMLKRGHHTRCYRYRATDRFLIWGMRGAEFIDLRGEDHAAPDWLRSGCGVGVMPANGLLYATPDPCQCYKGVKLPGFKALAGGRGQARVPAQRLERGPAFDRPMGRAPSPSDWPMYRRDPARLAVAPEAPAGALAVAWTTQLGRGRTTPPVISGGRLYAAVVDERRLCCLDARTGAVLWEHVAGGPIDQPPTIAAGRVYFGSLDGTVTCLDAVDGAVAWRFLAAPERRMISAFGTLASAWPVHGSVLVLDGLVYAAAGRNTYVDGGLQIYALDARDGSVRHHTVLAGPESDRTALKAGVASRYPTGYVLDGGLNDCFVLAGDHLALLFNQFDRALKPLPTAVAGASGQRDLGTPRVIASGGFHEQSIFSREFWTYSRYWWFPDYRKIANFLAVDGDQIFGATLFTGGSGETHKVYRWTQADSGTRLFRSTTQDAADPMPTTDPAAPGRPQTSVQLPIVARGLVKAGNQLVVAGPASAFDAADPLAPFENCGPAQVITCSTDTLAISGTTNVPAIPVFDGVAAVAGDIFVGLVDGRMICLRSPSAETQPREKPRD